MHRAWRTYDPERPVVPWSLAIARHVFLMDCRTRRWKGECAQVDLQDATAGTEPRHEDALLARGALDRGLEGARGGV